MATALMTRNKKDGAGRTVISDQELVHELDQLAQLAAELHRRLTAFCDETSIRPTVLSSVISSQRNAKAVVNHLRAAAVLVEADI